MTQQTLLAQVREAHQLAVEGKLLRNKAEEILAAVRAYLEALEQAGASAHHDDQVRLNQQIGTAIKSLSLTELVAVEHIMAVVQADGNPKGTLLVASKIADQYGFTRSVIVNGLRKLESAGMIQTHSLGMKGTMVKVLVPEFLVSLIGHKQAA